MAKGSGTHSVVSVQPGSLIFLVIVAVWAVYLVQHWIRRREHLATARSVDRFSDAMRVLERRAAPLASAMTTPYAASRLSPAGAGVARPGAAAPSAARPALIARKPVLADHGSSGPEPVSTGAVRARRAPAPRGRLVRRVRGLAVLATLLALPLTAVLSMAGVLRWVSVLVSLAALVVVVAWTRASVRREQAVRRAARVAQRRRVRPPRTAAPASGASRVTAAREVAGSEGAGSGVAASGVAASGVAGSEGAVAGAARQVAVQGEPVQESRADELAPDGPVVYDLMAVDEQARAAAAAAVFAQEWSPVPVPTPTYMLKDSAPRQAVEWGEFAGPPAPSMVPVPIEVEDEELEQLMAARHRRVVG